MPSGGTDRKFARLIIMVYLIQVERTVIKFTNAENVEDEKPVSVSATKFKDEDLSSAKITQKELYVSIYLFIHL